MMRPLARLFQYGRWSLQTYLLAALLALAIPLVCVLAYSIYDTVKTQEVTARATALNLAKFTANEMEELLQAAEQTLSRLAQMPEIKTLDAQRCAPVLRAVRDLHPKFANASVMTIKGELVCSALPLPSEKPLTVADTEWFQRVVHENQFVVSDPFFGRISGRIVIVLAYPIIDASGQPAGVVTMPIALHDLRPYAYIADYPRGTSVTIINNKGVVIARHPYDGEWIGKNIREHSVAAHALEKDEGTHEGRNLANEEMVFGFTGVRAAGWRVIAALPASAAYAQLHSRIARGLATALLIVLLATAAAAIFGRRVTRPIRSIAAAAHAVASGDLSARVPDLDAVELSEVASQFNRMLEVRLHEETKFRSLLEAAPDAMVIVNDKGNIVLVNSQTEYLFGYSRQELLGQPVEILLPERFRKRHDALRAQYFIKPVTREMGKGVELSGQKKTGEEFPIEVSLSPLQSADGLLITSAIRDITERRQAQHRIVRLNNLYAALSATNQAITKIAGRSKLLHEVCRIAVEHGGFMLAWVGMVDADSGNVVPEAATGAGVGYVDESHICTDPAVPHGCGPTARAIRSGKSQVSNDLSIEPSFAPWREAAARYGLKASAAFPLREDGHAIGALNVYAGEAGFFDDQLVALLEEMASDVSFALDNIKKEARHHAVRHALTLSEQKFRLLVETTTDAVVIMNDALAVVYANPAVESMFGYSSDSLIGRHVSLLQPTPLRTAVQRMMDAFRQSEDTSRQWNALDTKGLHRLGHEFPIEISASAVRMDGQVLFTAFIRDITERRQAENRLRENERRLSTLFANLPGAVYRCRNDRAWTTEFVSDGALELTGYKPEDFVDNHRLSFSEVIHPDERERVWRVVQQALETRQPFQTEYRITAADGAEKWVWEQGCGIYAPDGSLSALEGFVADVTTRKHAELARTESEVRFRQLAENMKEVFWLTNPEKQEMLYISPAYEAIWGHSCAELYANPRLWLEAIHPDDRERVLEAALSRQALGTYDEEYRIVRSDGSIRWIHDRAFPVRDESGNVYRIAGTAEDITERKESQERLSYLAQYDTLTGLPNRSLFRDRLEQAMARTRRGERCLALMFLDLDRFKEINDRLGHSAGDEVLVQVANRLRTQLRPTDTIARLGGDEFTIILEDLAAREEAEGIAHKILDTLTEPIRVQGREIFVTASIGVTLFPLDVDGADALIKSADIAMYQAKQAGRNTVTFYSKQAHAKPERQLDVESKLRRALERQEFVLHYQPQVDVASGAITGAEALIRWDNPDLGRVSPADFIPLAEETGVIVSIGDWVIETASAQARAWQQAGLLPLVVAVNISARQFRQKGLVQGIAAVLERSQLAAHLLELELTESIVMHQSKDIAAALHHLSAMGVQISIDDFGTGYSSLAYLKRFPVHKLKIDQSFVRDIVTDSDSAAIVRGVIAMARGLHLKTIAEGVETREQLDLLALLGCHEYQGYLFSRPLPADAFTKLLESHQQRLASQLQIAV